MPIIRALACWFFLTGVFSAQAAVEVLDSPLKLGVGLGTGIFGQAQYSGDQPTLYQTYSVSTDLRWRRFQVLLEADRWSEKSASGALSVNTRHDLYSLFFRGDVLQDDWFHAFVGAGYGLEQNRVQAAVPGQQFQSDSNLDGCYGADAGLRFTIFSQFNLEIFGRLMSQPYDSRWTRSGQIRLSYDVF